MKNKKVVITGGSEGLGKEVAKRLTALGAKVIILARNEEKLAAAAKEIGCDYMFCNVGDLQCCYEAHEEITKKYGDIDILMNNAGIWTDDALEETNPGLIYQAFETNIIGAIQMTNQFLPRFKELNHGTFLNINSVSGRFPIVDSEARTYSATKWALRGYSEALKEHLKGTNIKVIQIFPCGFDTNIFETSGWSKEDAHNQSWMAKVETIAESVVFALTAPNDVTIGSIVIEKSMSESLSSK